MEILLGLIIGSVVAFFTISILQDRNKQESLEEDNKQKTPDQTETKINNIVIPSFLVIGIGFLLGFVFEGVFGVWFAIGGVIGIVGQNITNKPFAFKVFAEQSGALTGKQKKQAIGCFASLGAILLLGFACSQSNDTKFFNIPGGFITSDDKRTCVYSESSGRWACMPNK